MNRHADWQAWAPIRSERWRHHLSGSRRTEAFCRSAALDFEWQPEKVKDASFDEALQASPQVAASRVWHASDQELPDIRTTLATEASIRNDLHLVKYTRATFDMGSFDPDHTRLYLAAAAHLCAVWIKQCPRNTLLDHLLDGRDTPQHSDAMLCCDTGSC